MPSDQYLILRYDSSNRPASFEGIFTSPGEVTAYVSKQPFPEFLRIFKATETGWETVHMRYPEPEPVLTVVVALDYLDFRRWCQATNHNPRDRNLLYARDITALYGLQGPLTIVTTRLGGNRLDAVDIHNHLHIINLMSRSRKSEADGK